MDASRSGNGSVGGIPQSTQRGDIQGHFVSQRKDAKGRVGIQVPEEFIQADLQRRLFSAGENGDFQEADGAEGHWLAAPDGRFQRSQLRAGELSRFDQPSNQDVRVQQ